VPAGKAITILTCIASLIPVASAESPVELYRRLVPLEESTGLITVKESVARELDVPERCEDGWMHCSVLRRFAHLYTIDFAVETRRQQGDDIYLEREPRGRLHLALAATRDDEESYDELLRNALSDLSAAAFDTPFAGLRLNEPPFGPEVTNRAAEPSWGCFLNDGANEAAEYKQTIRVDAEGNERRFAGMSSYVDDEVTQPLCAELESATAAAYPEQIRTMSTPRLVLEQTFTITASDMLRDNVYLDELVQLPQGCDLSRKKTPGVKSMQRSGIRDGIVSAARTREEVEISGRVTAAELPQSAAGENAWHSRWTMQTLERTLGPLPEQRLLERWSLTVSLMPMPPPRDLDDPERLAAGRPDGPYEVRFDEQALFDAIAEANRRCSMP
jgi:hypothetical protein